MVGVQVLEQLQTGPVFNWMLAIIKGMMGKVILSGLMVGDKIWLKQQVGKEQLEYFLVRHYLMKNFKN